MYFQYWYRKKRSLNKKNSTESTPIPTNDQNSTAAIAYEYYEAYMPQMEHRPKFLMTEAKLRSKLTILPSPTKQPRRQKPKRPVTTPPPIEAGEASDLADDTFFFKRLKERTPPKQDNDEVEVIYPDDNSKSRKEEQNLHKDEKEINEKGEDYDTYYDNDEKSVGDDDTNQEEDYDYETENEQHKLNYGTFHMKQQNLGKDSVETVHVEESSICKDHLKPACVQSKAERVLEESSPRKYGIKQKRNDVKNFATPEQLYAEIQKILEQKRKNRRKNDDFYELRIQSDHQK